MTQPTPRCSYKLRPQIPASDVSKYTLFWKTKCGLEIIQRCKIAQLFLNCIERNQQTILVYAIENHERYGSQFSVYLALLFCGQVRNIHTIYSCHLNHPLSPAKFYHKLKGEATQKQKRPAKC